MSYVEDIAVRMIHSSIYDHPDKDAALSKYIAGQQNWNFHVLTNEIAIKSLLLSANKKHLLFNNEDIPTCLSCRALTFEVNKLYVNLSQEGHVTKSIFPPYPYSRPFWTFFNNREFFTVTFKNELKRFGVFFGSSSGETNLFVVAWPIFLSTQEVRNFLNWPRS